MSRHSFDLVPFVTGALFVVLGATYALADLQDQQVRESLVGTAEVVGLALLAFAATVRGIVRSIRAHRQPADPLVGDAPVSQEDVQAG